MNEFLKNNKQYMLALAVATAFFTFIVSLRNEGRTDFSEVVSVYQKDNERLREKNETLEDRIVTLERKINFLEGQVMILESGQNDFPYPVWYKSMTGVMLAVNKAYVKEHLTPFGFTAADYIGKTDVEMWGHTKGTEHWNQALEAISNKNGFQDAIIKDPNTGKPIRVINYIRKIGALNVGISGISLPVQK
mgnify:CR=1 FL=1|jgi:cell division protein FtsB